MKIFISKKKNMFFSYFCQLGRLPFDRPELSNPPRFRIQGGHPERDGQSPEI